MITQQEIDNILSLAKKIGLIWGYPENKFDGIRITDYGMIEARWEWSYSGCGSDWEEIGIEPEDLALLEDDVLLKFKTIFEKEQAKKNEAKQAAQEKERIRTEQEEKKKLAELKAKYENN